MQKHGAQTQAGKTSLLRCERDSVSVRVRFSPQKHDGLWYESWIVGYSFHGLRIRERCNTLRRAKACADAAASKLARGEMQALELRGEDRRRVQNWTRRGIPAAVRLAGPDLFMRGARLTLSPP